jgi:hypothetical protein
MTANPIPSRHNAEKLAAHLRRFEEALLDPAVRNDRTRVSHFLAEDFFEFGSSGKVWAREEILGLLATEQYDPPVIESFECRLIAPNVAHVTYRAVHTNAATGKRQITLRSSIWSEISGAWRICFHQGTRAV